MSERVRIRLVPFVLFVLFVLFVSTVVGLDERQLRWGISFLLIAIWGARGAYCEMPHQSQTGKGRLQHKQKLGRTLRIVNPFCPRANRANRLGNLKMGP